MVTQLCTFARNHWIVHLNFIVCINLLKISRMNLKMKCFYENLKHSSRERNSRSLDILATRSYQLLVLVSEKSKKLWLSFLSPWKKTASASESEHRNLSHRACVCLWLVKHYSSSHNLPPTEHDRTLAGSVLSLKEHEHHVVCIYWAI